MIRIKITLLLIALLSGKYKIPHFFFYSLQYLHFTKQTTEMKKKGDFKQGARLMVRPPHAGGIRKRMFISPVRLIVHTNASQKRSFLKTLLKPEEYENASFALCCGQ